MTFFLTSTLPGRVEVILWCEFGFDFLKYLYKIAFLLDGLRASCIKDLRRDSSVGRAKD